MSLVPSAAYFEPLQSHMQKSEGEKKVTKPKSTGVKKTGAKKPIGACCVCFFAACGTALHTPTARVLHRAGKEAPAKGAKKVVSKTPKSKAKAAADPKE